MQHLPLRQSSGVNRLKVLYAIASTMALVAPYATGAVMYFYAIGVWNIQPKIYMSLAAGLVLVNTLLNGYSLGKPVIWLFLLLGSRFLDPLVTGRILNLDGIDPVSLSGSSVVFCFALVGLSGSARNLKWAGYTVSFVVLLTCCVLNAWEWRNPGTFSTVEGRAAGWLQNANDSATAIVSMLGLLLALRPPKWIAVALISISGIGVYFTLSRSGALVWLVICATFILRDTALSPRRLVSIFGLLIASGLLVIKLVDFQSMVKDSDVRSRQDFLTGRGSMDLNDTSRMELLADGIRGIIQNPVLGYGTFSSYNKPFQPHNEAVAVWLDGGVVGFVFFSAALLFLLVECFRIYRDLLVACVPIIALIPFSHNLLENSSYLFLWMMTANLVAQRKSRRTFFRANKLREQNRERTFAPQTISE